MDRQAEDTEKVEERIMTKLIFLDIDGVLNNHPCWPKGPELHRPQCDYLQQIIKRTGAEIVLTSSWRAWIADGSMTCVGFKRLLDTHGIHAVIHGFIQAGPVDATDRADAIHDYLTNGHFLFSPDGDCRFAILDDLPIADPCLVRTDGYTGLTAEHVERACKILGEKKL